jgi:preprotein translocase subunit SecF
VEVSYVNRPDRESVVSAIETAGIVGAQVQPVASNKFVIRTKDLSESEKAVLLTALGSPALGEMTVDRFNSIGPVVGNELRKKAFVAIGVVILLIVLFVTYVFRKVSEPVSSFKYGLATIVALAHDVILPAGAFIAISYVWGGEIDMLFVSAILAILGFSVHDTIVVFDRVREHLSTNRKENIKESFDITVGKSIEETFARSINTSLTIFIVLIALFWFGPETTQNFTLTLIIGIVAGTYSSIFIASPLLVTFEKMQSKKSVSK